MSSTEIIDVIRNCRFSRTDLEAYATESGAGRGAIEKDFFISIILIALGEMYEFSKFRDRIVFKGGTCIKKVFYPHDARFSEDLDFSNLSIEDCRSFLRRVDSVLVGQNLGVTRLINTQVIYEDERGLDIQLNYLSLLGQRNHIMINLSTASALRKTSESELHVRPYFELVKTRIFIMDINEILAEKTRALLQRHRPRDVFDVWFLMDKKGMKLDIYLLKEKLNRSYNAAPPEKRKDLGRYTISSVISGIKDSVTQTAWRNELGGLLMRPFPDRKFVIERVSEILVEIGDISVA